MTMRMATKVESEMEDVDASQLDDLIKLTDNSSSSILHILQSRIKLNQLYTNVGSRVLLYTHGNNNIIEDYEVELEKYVKEYRSFDNQVELPPHVFKLANKVYFHLRRSNLDQAVIFCGDAGSGKSHNKALFLRSIAALRKASKKETRIYNQILNSELIFDAFGSTYTNVDTKTSKFIKYIELQFDNKGHTIGVKYLDYLLEKNKLTSTNRNESNFLVLYQFLTGTSDEERNQFNLKDMHTYNYLQGNLYPHDYNQLNYQFLELKKALKSLGFTKKFQSQIFQLLAAILHLGNIKFMDRPVNNTDGGALIKDYDHLSMTAEFLGLAPNSLENLLTFKTQMIKKEACTTFLNANQASKQRDELSQCLYSLLFSWITEFINLKLCTDYQSNFIGILDLPGFQKNNPSEFEAFCFNFCNEKLYSYMMYQIFEASNDAYDEDNVLIPKVYIEDNVNILQLLTKSSTGLISIMNKQINKIKGPSNDVMLLQAFNKVHDKNELMDINLSLNQFTIHHFNQSVTYDINGFMNSNMDNMDIDFIHTFRNDINNTSNSFISGLFNNNNISKQFDENHLINAQQSVLPKRKPSMKRERVQNKEDNHHNILYQLKLGIDELLDTFDNTETWFMLGLLNDANNSTVLEHQIQLYKLNKMIERKRKEYTICYLHEEFTNRYYNLINSVGINLDTNNYNLICEAFKNQLDYNEYDLIIGHQYIYLNEHCWKQLEDGLRCYENGYGNSKFGINLPTLLSEDNNSEYSEDESELNSQFGDASQFDLELVREKQDDNLIEEEEDIKPTKTKIRKAWICLTWALTWWIPSFFLSCCGRMKLNHIKMAWREKVALCIIILFMSAFVVLFIVGVNPLLCPERNIYTTEELNGTKDRTYGSPLYSMYGRVYELYGIDNMKNNGHYGVGPLKMKENYGGRDISDAFPIQINPNLCLKYDGSEINPQIALTNITTNGNTINHDHRYYRGSNNYKPNWFENVVMNRMKKVGDIAYTIKDIEKKAQTNKIVIYLDNSNKNPVLRLYDFTPYFNLMSLPRENEDKINVRDEGDFLGPIMSELINSNPGKDITKKMGELFKDDIEQKQRIIQCMNNLFYMGLIDDRNSFQCIFAQYLLLALSVFLFAILFVKFLASLQLGSRPEPEDHDKFVICNVPCYTEDLESLKRTIDSLAILKYDDKRKLLFIVSDGMVIGGGNDLPTPKILLNLLGSDPNLNPEALSFLSLGEGSKQHNMAKVYTGLYEIRGHVVPYLVVVKVGKPSERVKPGNRGKRDSQLILMKFFNKVHYDYPMVPLELEMYHQIKNIIGVDPKLYEFILMVDADTIVMSDSLNRLVSAMLHDIKIMGICGETSIMNEKDSWATMIQVYEYYMSHHLSKAFESLFGSVTCLPGCFSMYRIRSANDNSPLLIHDNIVNQYSENEVDTLHKKNLFHLGEDRYLTTLMLKNFPFYKLTFTPDAKCLTNAPDTWDILLSQRRRWINSTVHNLLELVFLPRLCGFCCFSMRFVVFMDLLSTVIMPATLGYLGYLLYRLITDRNGTIPIASLVFICAPYVLQMLVFLIRRQWQQIGWMIVYLLALPVFAFFIPLYSFWHFDDFSWGNTRVVLGEGGKKKKVAVDEGTFDPTTIPTRKWSEYEEENWELATEKTSHTYNSSPSNNSLNRLPVTNASSNPFALPNIENIPMYPIPTSQSNFRPTSTFSNMPIMTSIAGSTDHVALTQPAMVQPTMQRTFNNEYISTYPTDSNLPTYKGSKPPSPVMKPIRNSSFPSSLSPPLLPNFNPSDNFPDHLQIVDKVRSILSQSDLMSISKKQVRLQLAQLFGFDFEPYKEQINYWIEGVLKGQI